MLEKLAPDVQSHSAVQKLDLGVDGVATEIFEMLLSVPVAVMHGICGAGLRRRKASDVDIYAWLVKNYVKSVKRPCVYMLELTDQIGRAPTRDDLSEIVLEARRYLEPDGSTQDQDLAIRIDSFKRVLSSAQRQESRTQNWRFYLRSADARDDLKALLDELEKNVVALLQSGHSATKPMPWVLRDVGYTHDGHKRLKAQENLSGGSNLLMSLFSAIAQTHPVFKARAKQQTDADATAVPVTLRYAVHGEVIFLCFRRFHAVLAECMFSCLAQSYSSMGKGFNTVQAGTSVASNKHYKDEDWADWQFDVLNESPFEENAKADDKMIEELEAVEESSKFLKYHAVLDEIATLEAVKDRVDELMMALGD